MARRNPGRTLGTARTLAERIKYEREQRGLTMEALAQRMKDAGCPIHHTAVYKIEQGHPPRTVSFEEAVAFAQVFGLAIGDLAIPPATARNEEAKRLLKELFAAIDAGEAAAKRQTAAQERLGRLVRGDTALIQEVHALLEPTRLDADAFLINVGALTLDDQDNLVPAAVGVAKTQTKRARAGAGRAGAEGES